MGLLDAQTGQLVSSSGSFADKSGVFRATISSAEHDATAAQAFHHGESSAAFQAAHARFVEAAAKINALLDVAQANLGDAATTYVAQDGAAAASYGQFA